MRLRTAIALKNLGEPRRKRRRQRKRFTRVQGRDESVDGRRRRHRQRGRWGDFLRIGHRLRIQAAEGWRAAVVELRPGLYLVAEVPERATQPEVGVLPLLAPLVVKAASTALKQPAVKQVQKRVVKALLPGPVEEEPEDLTWVEPEDIAGVLEGR